MIAEIRIENLGVIEAVALVLEPGLVALTGETGAGKTMIVEAINLLVGARADATVVRPGAAEARVEGRFVVEGQEIVLTRVVPADGRSRAYVNGRLATVGQLAEIGERVVDLHGQHAHQSLLGAAAQRAALDAYGRVDLGPLSAVRAELTEIEANMAALGGDERTRAREIDLLRFQADEIEGASIAGPDEDVVLSEEEDLLADATAAREALWRAHEALAGEGGASDILGGAVAALAGRPGLTDLASRVREAQTLIQDLVGDLRDGAESAEEDPARLEAIRERRQLLSDLRRKYGDTLADVSRFGAVARDRLSELEGYEARTAELEGRRADALERLAVAQAEVKEARLRCTAPLSGAIMGHLASLAMPRAQVSIEVGGDAGESVAFLLAANPGAELQPLAKVASGGELARTMLALRLVLSQGPETLVFDEVDAGIGGEAAVAVGRALAGLGRSHQVLVVTHLPQVAAMASQHLAVRKEIRDDSTFASVGALTEDERAAELARMLSGDPGGEAALAHARVLLAARTD
ncbi:MAG: DNA repair protein RecN [Acidobacteria bacterium]|nr:DNA repair protein RecN [Acidobacteriota bacterium]